MLDFWRSIAQLPYPRSVAYTRSYGYDRTIRISYTTELVHEYRFDIVHGKILPNNICLYVNGRFIIKMDNLDNTEHLIDLLDSCITTPDDWRSHYDKFLIHITKKRMCIVA